MRAAAEVLRGAQMTPQDLVAAITSEEPENDKFPFSQELSAVRAILIKGKFKAWCIRRVLSWR